MKRLWYWIRSRLAPRAATTIHKVEIVVSGNDDPSRIARLVREELETATRR